MPFTIGLIGAGQFADTFAPLLRHHPLVSDVWVTDVLPERAERLASVHGLSGTMRSFDEMIAAPQIDAVAIFTQRWTHGELALRALHAGKHVYSTVPMGITVDEIGAIVDAVAQSGLVYMMGETSYYNPATVLARANLTWQPTANDYFQVNGVYSGRQILPQGYREGNGVLNLGYRRKVDERFSVLLTVQNVLDTARQVVFIDTPTIRDRLTQRGPGQIFFLGLTYNLGAPNQRRREPAFEFDSGAGAGAGR